MITGPWVSAVTMYLAGNWVKSSVHTLRVDEGTVMGCRWSPLHHCIRSDLILICFIILDYEIGRNSTVVCIVVGLSKLYVDEFRLPYLATHTHLTYLGISISNNGTGNPGYSHWNKLVTFVIQRKKYIWQTTISTMNMTINITKHTEVWRCIYATMVCWLIVKWTLRNKLQLNLYQNTILFKSGICECLRHDA